MLYKVTFEVKIPQPYDFDTITVTRTYPRVLTNADNARMELDSWAFCCLILAEYPSAEVDIIEVEQV